MSSKQSRPENSLGTLSPSGRFEDSLDLILSLPSRKKRISGPSRIPGVQPVPNRGARRPKTESSGKLLKTSPKDLRASSGTEYEGQLDYLCYPRADSRRPGSFKSSSDYQWIPSKASAFIQLGGKKREDGRPRPIIAKFKHFKHKEFVRSQD